MTGETRLAPAEKAVGGDRRSPAPTKGERQRRAILDSLVRLLETRPIGELTVAEIASATRVGRSGFYVYFETKYAALSVLTTEVWSDLMNRADDFIRGDDESVIDFLDRTARTAMAMWREQEAVLVASIQAIPLDEQIAELWEDWNGRLSQALTEQVLRDLEQGAARPASADVTELVATLHEMTQHMFYLDRLHKNDEAQSRRVLETVRAIWVASIWGGA